MLIKERKGSFVIPLVISQTALILTIVGRQVVGKCVCLTAGWRNIQAEKSKTSSYNEQASRVRPQNGARKEGDVRCVLGPVAPSRERAMRCCGLFVKMLQPDWMHM